MHNGIPPAKSGSRKIWWTMRTYTYIAEQTGNENSVNDANVYIHWGANWKWKFGEWCRCIYTLRSKLEMKIRWMMQTYLYIEEQTGNENSVNDANVFIHWGATGNENSVNDANVFIHWGANWKWKFGEWRERIYTSKSKPEALFLMYVYI